MWMTAFQASHSLPTITLASTISGLGQPPLSARRHCQHSCEPNRQTTGGKYRKVRWRVRVTTEGEEKENFFRCPSIDNSHTILGNCRTDSRTIGVRGLFMCETNEEYMDRELFALFYHLMKHVANDLLRHMPSTLLHIYLQVWAIQTAKIYGQIMGNNKKKLFTWKDLTLTIQIAEKCTHTLTVTHIEIFHPSARYHCTVKSATKYFTLCSYKLPVRPGTHYPHVTWAHVMLTRAVGMWEAI